MAQLYFLVSQYEQVEIFGSPYHIQYHELDVHIQCFRSGGHSFDTKGDVVEMSTFHEC